MPPDTSIRPAARYLCRFLAQCPALLQHYQPLIELGAGTGLAGILASKILAGSDPTSVVLTDHETVVRSPSWYLQLVLQSFPLATSQHLMCKQVLKLLQDNVSHNAACASVRPLDWRQFSSFLPAHAFRLCLAADVLYASNIVQVCKEVVHQFPGSSASTDCLSQDRLAQQHALPGMQFLLCLISGCACQDLAGTVQHVLHPDGVFLCSHSLRRTILIDPVTRLPCLEEHDSPWQSFQHALRTAGYSLQQIASDTEQQTTGVGADAPLVLLAASKSLQALEQFSIAVVKRTADAHQRSS